MSWASLSLVHVATRVLCVTWRRWCVAEGGASPRGHPQNRTASLWPQAREAALAVPRSLDVVQGAEDWRLVRSSTCSSATPSWRALENLVGSGTSGGVLLAIEGPPGIGKTALMAEAKSQGQRGRDAGARAREARSSSVRSRSASCGSFSSRCSRRCRSEERADALAGAAALAEPLFNPERLDAETGADSSLGDAARPLLAVGEPRRAPTAPARDRRPALVRSPVAALARLPAAAHRGARPLGPRRASGRPRPARIRACSTRSSPTRWRP